jgi:tetratricopeptide (TPR) repeat protein
MIRSVSTLRSLGAGAADKFLSAYRKGTAQNGETPDALFSMGICFMEKKDYARAVGAFEKAIDLYTEDSEVYYYAAVAMLKGKMAFLTQRKEIDKILEYIDEANRLEERGIYHYFSAYIRYDFFTRKCLNSSPDYSEALSQAMSVGLTNDEVNGLYEVLGVERPQTL